MMHILALLAIVAAATAQPFSPPFILTGAQEAKCSPTGYFADGDDPCCTFIQCHGSFKLGWRHSCQSGTLWNPVACACVVENQYPDPELFPNITACYDPAMTPRCVGFDRTVAACPDNLDRSSECCLEGRVYFAVNETAYSIDDDETEISCPEGQEFLVDDCCCEGETGAVAACTLFDLDGPDNAADPRGINGEPLAADGGLVGAREPGSFEPVSQGTGAGSVWVQNAWVSKSGGTRTGGNPPDPNFGLSFGSTGFSDAQAQGGGSFFGGGGGGGGGGDSSYASAYQYTNSEFKNGFSTSFWVEYDGEQTGNLFHNGVPGEGTAEGASVSIELQQEGGQTRIVGGFTGKDRIEDAVIETSSWEAGSWHFVSLSTGTGGRTIDGESQSAGGSSSWVSLTVDDQVVTTFEEDPVETAVLTPVLDFPNTQAVNDVNNIDLPVVDRNDDNPPFTQQQVDAVEDCLDQVTESIEANQDYLASGFEDFDAARDAFRKASQAFNKKKKRNQEKAGTLRTAADNVDAAVAILRGISDAICDSFGKICDLIKDPIFRHLNGGSQKSVKKLKKRLSVIKDKLNGDNPGTGNKFGLRTISDTTAKARELITSSGFSRKRRQTVTEEETGVRATKYPITIGEDLDGSIDSLVICDFAPTQEAIEALRDSGVTPTRPDLPF